MRSDAKKQVASWACFFRVILGQNMTTVAVTFVLGLGLFLAGIFLFARHAEKILGSDVKEMLKRAEGHKWFYLFLGIGVTAIVQSSSVVSSIVVGLVGSGIVSVFSGIIILAGSSIGSTITAQIISMPIITYGPLLIAIGLVLWTFGLSGKYIKILGIGSFSLGLLFVGLVLMTGAFAGIEETSWLAQQISCFAESLWPMFLIGLLVTIVLQSSSVSVGISMAMVASGLITPLAAIPFVLGATTGTNITVNLASLITSRPGKIMARGFFVYRLAAALLAMLLIGPFSFLVGLVTADPATARFVANAYTLFNVMAAIPLLFLVKHIAKVGAWLSPPGELSPKEFIAKIRKKKANHLGN